MINQESGTPETTQPILPEESLALLAPEQREAAPGQRIAALEDECTRLAIDLDLNRPRIEVYDRLWESRVVFDLQAMAAFLAHSDWDARRVQAYLLARGVLREGKSGADLTVAPKYRRMFFTQMTEVGALGSGLYSQRLVANLWGLEWLGIELGALKFQEDQAFDDEGPAAGNQPIPPAESGS